MFRGVKEMELVESKKRIESGGGGRVKGSEVEGGGMEKEENEKLTECHPQAMV